MELLIPAMVVFLAVLMLALAMVRRHDQASLQQMVLGRMSRPVLEDTEDVDITRRRPMVESAFLGNLFSGVRLIRRLEETLWQAGLYIKASDALALMLVLGLAGGAVGALWSGGLNFNALLSAVVAASLPLIYVVWRRRRRLKAFDRQLPEILDMLRSSLEAGHTLQRALQVAVEEFSDPASSELRIVLEQNRIGVPLASAMEFMLERVPDENLRFLVVATRIQTEVGSSLAGIVTQLSKTVRDRQRMEMKVRALTAQPRLGALLGGLMPIFLLIIMSIFHPEHTRILFHDPTGIKLTKIAVVLEVLSALVIYRMVRVDY
jgi:tight adherence protein B